jgi:hypothetical protein
MDWVQLKKILIEIKEKWAKTECYYSGRKYWGDCEGYTLKPPYTLEEIEQYEEKIKDKLPESFRKYLLEISREFFFENHPIVGKLYFNDSIYGNDDPADDPDDNDEFTENKLYNEHQIYIGTNGCEHTIIIILSGKFKGTVWELDQNSCYNYKSFEEYIKSKINFGNN